MTRFAKPRVAPEPLWTSPTASPAAANRRRFLGQLAVGATALGFATRLTAEPPKVANPRATDGDDRFEPDWEQRLTLTVGVSGREADLVGNSDKVLQAAVDYVARRGGGTVKVLPGTYTLRSAVNLASGVRLLGSGPETIITKIASQTVQLAADSDWYDQEITLAAPGDFRVGDSIVLRAHNPHNGGAEVIKRTLIAKRGLRFKLDDGLRKNLWLSGKPTCASLFPLLTAEREADIAIESLTLDGNRENNENLDGNHAGCVFLQDCNRVALRDVVARNYNGDGISFQICHDVRVQRCDSHGHAGLGLHPGSGSQRPVLLDNHLHGNQIGLFWCWGVKFGLAERNRIENNQNYGISIGHNDTDNVMRDNDVLRSGKVGVLFRDDARGVDFWANRNVLENNRIVDSGGEDGVAIDVTGKTREIRLSGNQISETRKPGQRIAIRLGKQVGQVDLSDNRIAGFARDLDDRRA
ncbi:MAG: right-handed parallel beta-helix repeat-containing protein [Planctomycetales bacterium]|nr:right-handed parallel beta-helix repeat-containing protein [Planctomycetales bacterium]